MVVEVLPLWAILYGFDAKYLREYEYFIDQQGNNTCPHIFFLKEDSY